ncbi:uncharacterized protein J4E87_005461 [Alternaria ethzedia]|uniref:uncharacterized protein n=1 Tax=Alternaria ethzedia TaxID=181014 RepID=UPI0020C30C43|nr:uncharacterized protein J4E87_005461 [Alternaria ethzedia]KAI4624980.1 hypothetical protein J4E87_005461 [Alternaria ethzedia]
MDVPSKDDIRKNLQTCFLSVRSSRQSLDSSQKSKLEAAMKALNKLSGIGEQFAKAEKRAGAQLSDDLCILDFKGQFWMEHLMWIAWTLKDIVIEGDRVHPLLEREDQTVKRVIKHWIGGDIAFIAPYEECWHVVLTEHIEKPGKSQGEFSK